MAKPTLTEVYQALGVLERAGMLESMQMKRITYPPNGNRLTATEVVAQVDAPNRKKQKRRKMTEADIDMAVMLHDDQGMTVAAIGREMGFSSTAINNNIF